MPGTPPGSMAIKNPKRNQNGSTPKKSPSPPHTPATIRFVRERRNAAPLTFISTSNPVYIFCTYSFIIKRLLLFSSSPHCISQSNEETEERSEDLIVPRNPQKLIRQGVGFYRSSRYAHGLCEARIAPPEKQSLIARAGRTTPVSTSR